MIDINKIIGLLDVKEITPNEFMLCMIIFHKNNDLSRRYISYLRKLNNEEEANARTIEELKNLEEKGYIVNLNPVLEGLAYFYVNNYMTTAKFEEHYLIDKQIAAEEILKTFPPYILINNVNKTPSINISTAELAEIYNSKIKSDLSIHKMVLEKIKKYKLDNKGYALQGLKKFIETEQWKYVSDDETGDILKIHTDDN